MSTAEEDYGWGDERDGYEWCPQCGDWIPEDEQFFERNDGEYICQSCYEAMADAVYEDLKEQCYLHGGDE